jgi:hypothetical protein
MSAGGIEILNMIDLIETEANYLGARGSVLPAMQVRLACFKGSTALNYHQRRYRLGLLEGCYRISGFAGDRHIFEGRNHTLTVQGRLLTQHQKGLYFRQRSSPYPYMAT